MNEIRFVYFDLGNVLLDFDHRLAARQMAKVAGLTTEAVENVVFDAELQRQYETGEISSNEFHEIFCEQTHSTPDLDELLLAGSDIFQLKANSIPLIVQLRAINFPMGILSNTCAAHWNFIQRRFPVIEYCFSTLALSFECGSMKPEAQIYQAAAEIAGLSPEQIFFTDDRADNIQGAVEAGFQCHLFHGPGPLYRELLSRNIQINL